MRQTLAAPSTVGLTSDESAPAAKLPDNRTSDGRSTGVRIPAQTVVDSWLLTEHLGSGSYSSVWAARPVATWVGSPADYAIKLLQPKYASDDHILKSLALEKQLGQELSHPHLVPVLDGKIDSRGLSYLLMPRLRGALVSESIARVGRFMIPHALWIMRQATEALAVLHGAGWVHGDIKPENLHVTADGHATLLDLGMACRMSTPAQPSQHGGSLAYMAPERLVLRSQVTHQSDIYSLGITLYEMLVGRHPHRCRSAGQWVTAHLTCPVTPPHHLWNEIPVSVSDLVCDMLKKEPLRRPISCDELRQRLLKLELETLALRHPAAGDSFPSTSLGSVWSASPTAGRAAPPRPHRFSRRPS